MSHEKKKTFQKFTVNTLWAFFFCTSLSLNIDIDK